MRFITTKRNKKGFDETAQVVAFKEFGTNITIKLKWQLIYYSLN